MKQDMKERCDYIVDKFLTNFRFPDDEDLEWTDSDEESCEEMTPEEVEERLPPYARVNPPTKP